MSCSRPGARPALGPAPAARRVNSTASCAIALESYMSLQALTRPTLGGDAVELGRFVYEVDGEPLQLFRIPVSGLHYPGFDFCSFVSVSYFASLGQDEDGCRGP